MIGLSGVVFVKYVRRVCDFITPMMLLILGIVDNHCRLCYQETIPHKRVLVRVERPVCEAITVFGGLFFDF